MHSCGQDVPAEQNLPTGHREQKDLSLEGAKLPLVHGIHVAALSIEKFPALQGIGEVPLAGQ